MRAGSALAIFSLACAAAAGACAMNGPGEPVSCTVTGADKLGPETGGADALCAAVRSAAEAEGAAGLAVELRIVSPYKVEARLTGPGGRRLPDRTLVRADRKLDRQALERFARDLALHARQQ